MAAFKVNLRTIDAHKLSPEDAMRETICYPTSIGQTVEAWKYLEKHMHTHTQMYDEAEGSILILFQ